MTGVETAAVRKDRDGTLNADLAPVHPSPLRERMAKKVAYWKSLRALSDEQEAALEFWQEYLERNPR